jgi:anti-sigma B factor antagonist
MQASNVEMCDNSAGSGARMQDTVAIEGRVTIDSSPAMRSKLLDALKSKPAEMVVDLSRVTYIDTSGLATLVEASRIAHQQGARLVLTGIQGQIRYLFDVSHLDQLFDIAAEQTST